MRLSVTPRVPYETVIELPGPFAPQELDDSRPALKEFDAIAPATVFGIGKRDPFGIARIPGILGIRTFCAAVSMVNGGWGGRIMNSQS